MNHFELIGDEVWTAVGNHVEKWTLAGSRLDQQEWYRSPGSVVRHFDIVGDRVWTAQDTSIKEWTIEGTCLGPIVQTESAVIAHFAIVPEPATLSLLALGALALLRRRRT